MQVMTQIKVRISGPGSVSANQNARAYPSRVMASINSLLAALAANHPYQGEVLVEEWCVDDSGQVVTDSRTLIEADLSRSNHYGE
jgi:hypothetical protein